VPELGHKKFQERLSGAFRMQENLSAAAASPRTPLSLSALWASPLTGNRRLGPPNMMAWIDPPMAKGIVG